MRRVSTNPGVVFIKQKPKPLRIPDDLVGVPGWDGTNGGEFVDVPSWDVFNETIPKVLVVLLEVVVVAPEVLVVAPGGDRINETILEDMVGVPVLCPDERKRKKSADVLGWDDINETITEDLVDVPGWKDINEIIPKDLVDVLGRNDINEIISEDSVGMSCREERNGKISEDLYVKTLCNYLPDVDI